jgi:hypothetical protein
VNDSKILLPSTSQHVIPKKFISKSNHLINTLATRKQSKSVLLNNQQIRNSQKGAPNFADSGSNIVKELEVLYKTTERFVIA